MHFNIYIDDRTGAQLKKMAKNFGKTRNALIREAIEEWIFHQMKPEWPENILSFKGMKNIPAFESHRQNPLGSKLFLGQL